VARYQQYSTLVNIEAVANALVVVVSILNLTNSTDTSLVPPQLLIGTSLLALAYFAIGHTLIKKKSEYASALIMTLLSVLNIFLLMVGNGGLDSPYFALWLGVIIVAGLFGRKATVIAALGTLAVIGLSWSLNYIPQVLGVLSAAALIEFIFRDSNKIKLQKTDETKKLKTELDQASFKAEALVNAMTEGVVVIDDMGHITLMNDAAAYMTGWSTVSSIGLDYRTPLKLTLKTHDGTVHVSDPLSQALTTGKAVASNDIILTSKDGKTIMLSVSATSVPGENGKPAGGIIVMRDITKQKELERQKDEFISTASHEMRTPVAAIEGYLSLAMNPKVATLDDRARNLLQKAHDSTGHLGALFRDLLSITKMEDGTKKLPQEAVNVSKLVTSVVSDMQFVAASKKLSLSIAGAAISGTATIEQEIYVMANPERLREVVMNLIENAIKYTPSGSITVSIIGNGQEATFSVTDTGPGIAPEDQPHLFEKFYRVAKTANSVNGTGLGLYLCRSVIESFGGHVNVSSTPGQGSTFGFTLPQLTPEQVTKAERDKQVLIQPTS
jgi:PAS domain S-box-containing protein